MSAMYNKARKRSSINTRVARAINNMTGGSARRGMIPAVMRSRRGLSGPSTELKSVDSNGQNDEAGGTSMALVAPANGTSSGILFQMPIEGASFYNRIARRTRGVSLEIRGHIKPSLANAAAKGLQWGRILIVYDRQANGAVPSLATVLADYDEAGNVTTVSTSGVNMDNRDRFLILRDRKFLLPPVGINGVAPTTTSPNIVAGNSDIAESKYLFTEYIKLNGLETQYKASTSGAIGDIATGSYLIYCLDELDLTTSAWKLTYTVRYKFYD